MSEAVTSSSEQKPSEVPVENKDEETMEAFNLLAQGKRNMLCGEMPQAINQLQEACSMLAKTYGETADQCGEAYFSYGKALLDMARMETGVLGNALQGMSEDEEEEKSSESSEDKEDKLSEKEKDEMSDKIIEAMEETDEELKARQEKEEKEAEAEGEGEKMETDSDEKKDETEASAVESEDIADEEGEEEEEDDKSQEEGETSQEEGEKSQEEGEKSQEEGEKSQEEGEKSQEEGEKSQEEGAKSQEEGETSQDEEKKAKEPEEDVSNLQLAWEMLELSKNIFKRQEDKEAKVKLAETHLRLGEVGLETEQYEQAVGDFLECLKIQKSILEPENRAMAETCYQLGLAHTFKTEYEAAVKHYKEAASIIEAKIASLTKIVEEADKSKGKDPATSDDPVVLAQKEISELKEILPDIMGKIEDVVDEQKSADTVKKMVKENLAAQIGGSSAQPTSTTGFGEAKTDAAPASDITHLVRKKRKTDEKTEDESKKAKTENGSGDAPLNGHANGTSEIKAKTVEDVKMAAESTS